MSSEPHHEGTKHELEVAAVRPTYVPIARGRYIGQTRDQAASLPGKHVKIVYVVRHGQAAHNAAAASSKHKCDCAVGGGLCPYISESLEDPSLTELGQSQAAALAPGFVDDKIDLLVVSPLQRALQTAHLAFLGSDSRTCPVVAFEDCREQTGQHRPDRRRPTSKIAEQFPRVDFSLIATEEDIMWGPDRETKTSVAARASNFIRWLFQREEQVVALVAHSAFILAMLNLPIRVEPEEASRWFNPGEARIFEIELIDPSSESASESK